MINTLYKPKGHRIWRWKFRAFPEDGRILDRSLGVSDKQVAEKRRMDLLREKEQERVGLIAPKATREAAMRELSAHLDDFLGDMERRGKSDKYLANLRYRVGRLIAECGWRLVSDVTADLFQTWLRSQTALRDKTANDYLEAARCFFNWLVKFNRAVVNPLSAVEKVRTKAGRAVERRALSDEEMIRLLAVAADNRLVYLMAAHTGLRRTELALLAWSDVHLDAPVPFVRVRASTTKNGKAAEMRLVPELASALREAKAAAAKADDIVFKAMPRIERFKRDLLKAGIQLTDSLGRSVVFHSLRHTFGTNLAKGGVASRVAMTLMRHSDRRLTDKIYTDENLLGTAAALDALPRYSQGSQGGSQILVQAGLAVSQSVTTEAKENAVQAVESEVVCHGMAQGDMSSPKVGNGGSGGARTRNLCRDRAAL